jgi:two-component system KDP operon response regulator KdpE
MNASASASASATPPKVLIVEDEAHLRRFLRTTLTHNGYEAMEAINGGEALERSASEEPSVILLDLGLPDVDGVEVVTRIRERSDVPIIVISARDFEYSKVDALDRGANDYVTKPFGASELLARIRAALRVRAQLQEAQASTSVTLGDLCVDFDQRIVKIGDQEVHLTPTEFSLLGVLARRAGRVVSHRELLHEVWGADTTNKVEYLRVLVRQLRYKLEREPSQPTHLLTIPGIGYRLLAS